MIAFNQLAACDTHGRIPPPHMTEKRLSLMCIQHKSSESVDAILQMVVSKC